MAKFTKISKPIKFVGKRVSKVFERLERTGKVGKQYKTSTGRTKKGALMRDIREDIKAQQYMMYSEKFMSHFETAKGRERSKFNIAFGFNNNNRFMSASLIKDIEEYTKDPTSKRAQRILRKRLAIARRTNETYRSGVEYLGDLSTAYTEGNYTDAEKETIWDAMNELNKYLDVDNLDEYYNVSDMWFKLMGNSDGVIAWHQGDEDAVEKGRLINDIISAGVKKRQDKIDEDIMNLILREGNK